MLLTLTSQQKVQLYRASRAAGLRAAPLLVYHFLLGNDFSSGSYVQEGFHQSVVYEEVVAQGLQLVSNLCLFLSLVSKVPVQPGNLAARASFQGSWGNHICPHQQGLSCTSRWNPCLDFSFSIHVTRTLPAKPTYLYLWPIAVANHRCLTCFASIHEFRRS